MHCVAPGVQDPVQAPLTHAWFVHGVAAPHAPVMSQVCVAALPEHCFAPGAQTPWQAPLTHAWLVQAIAVLQLPVASHVCTPLPEH
jgi:hypothetical protein